MHTWRGSIYRRASSFVERAFVRAGRSAALFCASAGIDGTSLKDIVTLEETWYARYAKSTAAEEEAKDAAEAADDPTIEASWL